MARRQPFWLQNAKLLATALRCLLLSQCCLLLTYRAFRHWKAAQISARPLPLKTSVTVEILETVSLGQSETSPLPPPGAGSGPAHLSGSPPLPRDVEYCNLGWPAFPLGFWLSSVFAFFWECICNDHKGIVQTLSPEFSLNHVLVSLGNHVAWPPTKQVSL